MKPKQETKVAANKIVRDIKRATRRKFSPQEKIRMALAGLFGEASRFSITAAPSIGYRREGGIRQSEVGKTVPDV